MQADRAEEISESKGIMSDYDSLLASVIADPDDDTPRLVMSDWLEEHDGDKPCGDCDGKGWLWDDSGGNIGVQAHCFNCSSTGRVPNGFAARAEFIRVQIELAMWRNDLEYRLENMSFDKQDQLRRREQELLREFGEQWVRQVIDWQVSGVRVDPNSGFSRGFITEITCTWDDWLAHHEAILAATPLRKLVLTTRVPAHVLHVQSSFVDGYFANWNGFSKLKLGRGSTEDEAIINAIKVRWPTLKEIELPSSEIRLIGTTMTTSTQTTEET